MIHDLKLWVCDECEKEKQAPKRTVYGPNPIEGWLLVSDANSMADPWNFCRDQCAIAFLQKRKVKA